MGHNYQIMETALIECFKNLDIHFENCGGQSNGNTIKMSDMYNGLQNIVKQISEQT